MTRTVTRRITVQGRNFLWVASGNDGYIVVFVWGVERARRLEMKFDYDVSAPGEGRHMVVTPRLIAKAITAALALGWDPTEVSHINFQLNTDDLLKT